MEFPFVCRPTRWFLIRAGAMLGMFLVFSVWFYYDAEFGYRKKNEVYFMERAFHKAVTDFTAMGGERMTVGAWREHASRQSVEFPEDRGVLPKSLGLPVAWPEILWDVEKVKSLNPAILWREYTASRGMEIGVPEESYSARKIREQWVVFWICGGLSGIAMYFLLRTMRRSLVVDEGGITDATGKRVAYDDLTLLDLRKWDTKGIAFLEYQDASGSGRMRIDGLTYGGFGEEDGQPAEQLMRMVRQNFSGEVLEYAVAGAGHDPEGATLADGVHARPIDSTGPKED